MPSCPSCGETLAPSGRFCAHCGAAVGVGATVTTPPPATATSPPPATPTPPSYHGRFDPGTRLGTRYRIVGLLGRGGMGEVYRADDLELGQPVALKFLPGRISATPQDLDRLRREVRIAREISHPNVCRTYDISAADGQAFLVMEYIDGEDLASVLRRLGRPSRDKAVEIARQLCLGLAAAHEHGVLHRDLKPANVMIDGRGRVRITDFGLAASVEELVADGTITGTPAYMAPEQLAGGAASVQSDLYALGLVLYELFTGKRAFDSHDPAVIRRLQTDSSPKSPSSLTPDIEPSVERVVMRCLEREPLERPGSAYAVLGALPGGDPLAAALAAGETPSPELVANARVEGSVKPAVAIACVLFVVATFGWRASEEQGRLKGFTRSDTELALRAADVLTKAGIASPPRYAYGGFRPKPGKERVPLYWRRWSPEPVVHPNLHISLPTLFVPPPVPGSAMVLTDLEGRLIFFEVVPHARSPGTADSLGQGDRAGRADWPALVTAAGYDASRMSRVVPSAHPVYHTDSVTAWSVPGTRPSDPPVTLLAGWLGGRVVHVSITSTWGTSLDPFVFRIVPAAGDFFDWIYLIFWVLVPIIGGVFFAARNLRAGRGDRRGATTIALFVFASYWLSHLVVQNIAQDGLVGTLTTMLDQSPIGESLLNAVLVWFMYVALEPYLRRLWPRVLVSWARLTTGRNRDPIIGRDILAGFVFAAATSALLLIAGRFGPSSPSYDPDVLYPLSGTGIIVAMVLALAAQIILVLMAFLTIVLALRLAFRRNDLAVVGATLLCTLAAFFLLTPNYGTLGAAFRAGAWAVLLGVVGMRFGLLAAMVGAIVLQATDMIPWTTDLSAWYSGRMWLVLGLLGALLVYGVATALAGRSILKDPIQEGVRG
jgi:predicted Ser/Thr protein kinase